MSVISKHYDRFAVAQANHIIETGIPEEFQEFPKMLYKGEGNERLSVEVANAEQEAFYATQGFAMHDPRAAMAARIAAGTQVPDAPQVPKTKPAPAPAPELKEPEPAAKPNVPKV